jgi:alanyl-tRNA synthetase
LLESAEQIDGVTVVVLEVPGIEANLMRQLIDQVRAKAAPSAVLLASRQDADKVTLVAGISKELQARKLSAGEWIRPVAAVVGGGGGGRSDMAQAGGKEPAKLPEALQTAKEVIRKLITG